jgi:hypothetical protein
MNLGTRKQLMGNLWERWPNKSTLFGLGPTNQVSNVRFVNVRIAGKPCRNLEKALVAPTASTDAISFTTTD